MRTGPTPRRDLSIEPRPTDPPRALVPQPKRRLQETLEEHFFKIEPAFKAESDKSWDALHRALSDGHLSYTGGSYPLSHVVLGGEVLYGGDDYIMSLKSPDDVRAVAGALPSITRESLRRGYDAIDEDEYGVELSDDDFEYTWGWFEDIREFWFRAAEAGRYVLFTADQ